MKKIMAIILVTTAFLQAQSSDGRSLGTAGIFTSLSRGVEAVYWNPANLAIENGHTVELNFFSINAMLTNNTFSVNSYNRYFTDEGHGGWWSRSDRNDILDLIPDDGLYMNYEVGVNLLGFRYKNFGFATQMVGSGYINALTNKKPLQILFFGETFDKDYQYSDHNFVEGELFNALKMSAAYGRTFDLSHYVKDLNRFSAGIAVNYYMGMMYAKTLESSVDVRRIEDETAGKTKVIYRMLAESKTALPENTFPTGTGLGMDLGATAEYRENWVFSFTLQNIFAGLRWDSGTELNRVFVTDTVYIDDSDDEQEEVSEDTTYAIGGFTTSLPSQMRFSAAYDLFPNLTLTAEWQQALDRNFRDKVSPRLGVGVRYYPLPWLPLRSGMRLGGGYGFLFALGSGVNFKHFAFDISMAMKDSIWPSYSEGILLATGFKFMF